MKRMIFLSLVAILMSSVSVWAQSPVAEQAHQRNEVRKAAHTEEKAAAVEDRHVARAEREEQRRARQEAARVDRTRRHAANRDRSERHSAQTQAPGQRVRATARQHGKRERVRFGQKAHQPKRHRVGG